MSGDASAISGTVTPYLIPSLECSANKNFVSSPCSYIRGGVKSLVKSTGNRALSFPFINRYNLGYFHG
jgi:hypothetical protein